MGSAVPTNTLWHTLFRPGACPEPLSNSAGREAHQSYRQERLAPVGRLNSSNTAHIQAQTYQPWVPAAPSILGQRRPQVQSHMHVQLQSKQGDTFPGAVSAVHSMRLFQSDKARSQAPRQRQIRAAMTAVDTALARVASVHSIQLA